jgi:anti-sigma factor RsiW
MPTCGDIEPLITALVDGEATLADRAVVSEHLRNCVPCRTRAADEDAARRILRERAAAFRVEAPAALRARCLPPPAVRPFFWPAVRTMPMWATAALVVTIAAGVFFAAGRGSKVLAAELALDHLKCFALFENTSGPGDQATIAGRLKAAYGWTIAVPASSAALGLRLVGGRRCFSTDGRVAHILYRHAGRPLSLFVVPGTAHEDEQLAVIGHEAIVWSQGGTTYVVLAREPRVAVAQVAAYIRGIVEQSGAGSREAGLRN